MQQLQERLQQHVLKEGTIDDPNAKDKVEIVEV